MPPKTPKELKDQVERQNRDQPAKRGHSKTAEGMETPNPKRGEFLKNLSRLAEPDQPTEPTP